MEALKKSKSIIITFNFILCFCCFQEAIFGQLIVPEKTELYRDDIVARIDIIINQTSLDFILAPENSQSDELFEATFIFSNENIRDTLEQVGFRLRGNTSRSANKKSFKIDLNEFVSGRKYYGVEKINLNGQHNDPTSSRSKICADLADRLQIPSLRTNHVELYINGNYYGLYTNVEHVDQNYVKKRFGNKNGNLYKCLYPADLNYKGENPNSYKEIIFGRRNYELKSNVQVDDYSDFANFVKILNLTSNANLSCELEKVFNVDQYLKTIIFDILTGNWDGPIYNKNNFYLYHNQATELFEYIPFDLDNTLGIDWLNKDWGERNIYEWSETGEIRPIYNRIMGIPEYRDRFSFYMQEVLLNIYNEAKLYPYLDSMRTKLKEYIADDTYYNLDYGFDVSDFENGFEYELPFFQTDYGIKSFIQTRVIAAFTQLEMNDILPVITERNNNHPNENETIEIQARIIDDQNISKVEVCYSINNNSEICVNMLDDGNQNDGAANDGIYGIILPSPLEPGELNYRINAVDILGQMSTSPRCSDQKILIEEAFLKLAINEFMAENTSTISDENGAFEDWIELHNYGTAPIYLGDKFLSDNPEDLNKWSMPNYSIEAGEYLLFWADDDRDEGAFHTNFKLSNGGEHLGIYDDTKNGNLVIDRLDFAGQISDISTGRIPNGTGDFVSLVPSPGTPNLKSNTNDQNSLSISIFPNPSSDVVEIITKEKIKSISIYNVIGEKIKNEKLINNILKLPSSSGVYYLQFMMNSGIPIVKKIIKI